MTQTPNFVPTRHRLCNEALERRLDSIKANAVVTAARQQYIFGMGPAQRHGCAGGLATLHAAVWQIIGVPKLLRQHAARIGEVPHRLDEGQRVTSGGEFVMAALAG